MRAQRTRSRMRRLAYRGSLFDRALWGDDITAVEGHGVHQLIVVHHVVDGVRSLGSNVKKDVWREVRQETEELL